MAFRHWTWGYDHYTFRSNLVFHPYNRPKPPPLFWENTGRDNHMDDANRAALRLQHLFGMVITHHVRVSGHDAARPRLDCSCTRNSLAAVSPVDRVLPPRPPAHPPAHPSEPRLRQDGDGALRRRPSSAARQVPRGVWHRLSAENCPRQLPSRVQLPHAPGAYQVGARTRAVCTPRTPSSPPPPPPPALGHARASLWWCPRHSVTTAAAWWLG